jgi:hypothetical protein
MDEFTAGIGSYTPDWFYGNELRLGIIFVKVFAGLKPGE